MIEYHTFLEIKNLLNLLQIIPSFDRKLKIKEAKGIK